MSTDLNCHSFPVTTGRAGARAGYAWLNMSRTDCSFRQHNDKDRSFKVPHLHAHILMHKVAHKQASLTRDTRTYTLLGMIDRKRHKGQQSAGLHLDRTRVLLHHLDLRDGADPNRSFPQSLHCNIQCRSATVLKG